jgi:NAD(P)-dependent dehydrogenase (short-subunit alcohol dehydrogenase family)
MTFQPQYAIVTASDSGIGRATAVALATAGLDVGITWHSDQDGAEQTAEEVRAAGRRAEVAHLDTSDLDRCGDVIDDLADRLGGLDVLVNNAGTGTGKLTIETSLQEWRQVIATDLDGAFICMQRAAQRMVAAGQGGRIIAVTSVHEHQPRVGSAAYDAAKHGLGGLAKTMALELGQHGITVNCVAPGEIATPMTGQEDEDPMSPERVGPSTAGCCKWARKPAPTSPTTAGAPSDRATSDQFSAHGCRPTAADGRRVGRHHGHRPAARRRVLLLLVVQFVSATRSAHSPITPPLFGRIVPRCARRLLRAGAVVATSLVTPDPNARAIVLAGAGPPVHSTSARR